MFDILIIGGGIIGGSIAFELARARLRVLLLDRQETGHEASWAAAGLLSASPESPAAIPLVPLARRSLEMYDAFVSAVESASGKAVSYRREGGLHFFFREDAERELNTFVALNRGVGVLAEPVSVNEARKMEPALSPSARAAAWLPEEGWVDNRALTRGVLAAAAGAGAEIRMGAAVKSLLFDSGRCTGARTETAKFEAPSVVVAAGCYSARIEGAESYAPAHPVRGQMAALKPAAELGRAVRSERGYLVPRDDGRILAGSTIENAGFEKRVTPAGLQQILSAALEIMPSLEDAAVVDTWSGLRPDSPDHLPILGPTSVPGLLVATGHYRNGILLAPVTAKLVAEWILSGKTSFPVEEFSPLRFSQRASSARS
jgi:glycine oxidase